MTHESMTIFLIAAGIEWSFPIEREAAVSSFPLVQFLEMVYRVNKYV